MADAFTTHRDEDESLAIDGQRMEAACDGENPLVAAGQRRLSRVDKANGLERGAAIAVRADDVPWRGTVKGLGYVFGRGGVGAGWGGGRRVGVRCWGEGPSRAHPCVRLRLIPVDLDG